MVMSNDDWNADFPSSNLFFADPMLSDHSPSILTMNPTSIVRKIPFRFKNFWTLEDGYSDVVNSAWTFFL